MTTDSWLIKPLKKQSLSISLYASCLWDCRSSSPSLRLIQLTRLYLSSSLLYPPLSIFVSLSPFVSVVASLAHIFSRSASCSPPLSDTNCPSDALFLPLFLFHLHHFVCSSSLHLSPSTPLFFAFICFWPGVGRPHIQWLVALLIFLKALLLVLYLVSFTLSLLQHS